MKELKALWDSFETYAIYGALIVFLFLQLISLFIPSVAVFMDSRGALFLIALVLLFIFRYIDERLNIQNSADLSPVNTFMEGIFKILERDKEYKTVEILSHSSTLYYYAFSESGARVKHLRLLLRDVDEFEDIRFPSNSQEKELLRREVEQKTKDWIKLQKTGRIETLTIKYYSFDPMYYFMLVDEKLAHFGFFQLKKDYPGTTALDSYLINNASIGGRRLISNFLMEFENIWSTLATFKEKALAKSDQAR